MTKKATPSSGTETKPDTKPDTNPESPETLTNPGTKAKPKPVAKTKIELLTHMIFEGESKAPGDIVEVPEADIDNWINSSIAKLPEPK